MSSGYCYPQLHMRVKVVLLDSCICYGLAIVSACEFFQLLQPHILLTCFIAYNIHAAAVLLSSQKFSRYSFALNLH